MQDSSACAKGNTPTLKPTKFRLACDVCQRSKIRCDQERPACRRCVKKGIECVYSPARRAGRPRTRNNNTNNNKNPIIETSANSSPTRRLTPSAERRISSPTARWIPPSPPPSTSLSSSEDSSACSTSTIPAMAPQIQLLSPDDMSFPHERQSDDSFLQGLMDLTASHGNSPDQTGHSDCAIFPDFHISPEFLDTGFCGMPWEPQQQEQQQGQNHQQSHNQRATTTTSSNRDDCSNSSSSYSTSTALESQCRDSTAFESDSLDRGECSCITTLLEHLSTQPGLPPSSSPSSLSEAALCSSKAVLDQCRTIVCCTNSCASRFSTALIICEAVDRVTSVLKLGGGSLWTATTADSPKSSALGSILAADDEQMPLRCGTLPIRGADRRAAVRVLLVKRLLELQGILEKLQQALVALADVDRPCWMICADIVAEFSWKVAERVDLVKLQI